MATLPTLSLTADGTMGANTVHDAGTGAPFYTHCNDTPNGGSSDWVGNDQNELSTTAWFKLTTMPTGFSTMSTLNIDVDVQAVGFSNDTCTLTCRIFHADNDTSTPLCNESGNLGTQADSTRTQRNVTLSNFTNNTAANWNSAYIRFTWTYTKNGGPDNAQLELFGLDLDGTYVGAVTKTIGTASRDYSTITSWEAAEGGGGTSDTVFGECYDDSVFDESFTMSMNVNESHLQVASGEKHDGTAGTGARIVFSTARAISISSAVYAKPQYIRQLEIDGNDVSLSADAPIVANAAGTTLNMERLLIHSMRWTSAGGQKKPVSNSGVGSLNILNCFIFNCTMGSSATYEIVGINNVQSGTHTLANTTVHYMHHENGAVNSRGMYLHTTAVTVKNCIVTDSHDNGGTDYYQGVLSYNLSSDTTSTGTGALTSKSSANQFVSNAAPFDLHLKATADAKGAGTDLVNTPTNVKLDIDDYDRDAGGVTWDMGADQYGLPAAASYGIPAYTDSRRLIHNLVR